jgi:signal transduction histidine kinase
MAPQPDDNGQMSADRPMLALDRLRGAVAFARSADARTPMTRRAVITDCVIAAFVLGVSLLAVQLSSSGQGPILAYSFEPAPITVEGVVAAVVTSVPLAARRRFPLAAYALLLAGGLVTRRYTTDVVFFSVVFAAYSAIAHSRFRGLALLIVPPAWMVSIAVLWLTPAPHLGVTRGPAHPHWILVAVLVLASMVTIVAISYAVHAGDAHARLQTEHEAATRRALELERARIASELHDVVTHNVSVMIVQAGAARQVLAEAPDDARAALLAVEASGRAAMAELRHLLGLLSPAAGDSVAEPETEPQPGVGQVHVLIERLRAAGLPVGLSVAPSLPLALSPGVDLAAYRVVQEALTNVIKHAGKPRTRVTLGECDGDLVIEVADAGRPIPAVAPAVPEGAGRGLAGLRERLAVYGGDLDAGPGLDGGWVVRARIPVNPRTLGVAADGLASAAGRR